MFTITSSKKKPQASIVPNWVAFLKALFGLASVGAEYQPLVDVRTGAVTGYEALARFRDEAGNLIANGPVFEALHRAPAWTFLETERALKRMHIRHAPRDGNLFLNFDPCSVTGAEPEEALRLVRELFAGRRDIVVEMVENYSPAKMDFAERITEELGRIGYPIAVDDIGAAGSVLSLVQITEARYLKFDRAWLSEWATPNDRCPREFLRAMIAYARRTGKTTVLEGVETEDHFIFARETGFDLVQGFRYRARFESMEWPVHDFEPVGSTGNRDSLMSVEGPRRVRL